jgi:hypothetical protein
MEYQFEKSEKNIIEIVAFIKHSPKMFFGEPPINIYYLYYYLLGYNAARITCGMLDDFIKYFDLEKINPL